MYVPVAAALACRAGCTAQKRSIASGQRPVRASSNVSGYQPPIHSVLLVPENCMSMTPMSGSASASMGQLMTTSSRKWWYISHTPATSGKPCSDLTATMLGIVSSTWRTNSTDMPAGWMRSKPHAGSANSITPSDVASQNAFVYSYTSRSVVGQNWGG